MSLFVTYDASGRIMSFCEGASADEFLDSDHHAGVLEVAEGVVDYSSDVYYYVDLTGGAEVRLGEAFSVLVSGTLLINVPVSSDIYCNGQFIGVTSTSAVDLAFEEPGAYLVAIVPTEARYESGVVEVLAE